MPLGEEEPTESTRGSIKPARFRESPTGLGSVTAHGCICHKDLGFGGETLWVSKLGLTIFQHQKKRETYHHDDLDLTMTSILENLRSVLVTLSQSRCSSPCQYLTDLRPC